MPNALSTASVPDHPRESSVRSYSRTFPVVFDRARGPYMESACGERYLDFFCGAGSLNYGHNASELKGAVARYLAEDRILHGMDMMTEAKFEFLETFAGEILAPRGLDYRLQFCGPTGTNAVEAALKLARKARKRRHVIAFSNAFHGVSMGALAVTASPKKRSGSHLPLRDTYFFPYEGFAGGIDTLDLLESCIGRAGSGYELPAAVILETVQGEGGVNVGSAAFLRGIAAFCRAHDILLIVDDIQMGCGRTGPFFSFERFGIVPDIVCLSKSLSGFGLPFSLVLMRPELDIWQPGEHAGTFRGNNLAVVAATQAIRSYWTGGRASRDAEATEAAMGGWAARLRQAHPEIRDIRGRGAIWGIEFETAAQASAITRLCFRHNLLIDTCGPTGSVIKIMPPVVIEPEIFNRGMRILAECTDAALHAGKAEGHACISAS
jgi:diaminobutyrate-2-oxoglutarate transaminase